MHRSVTKEMSAETEPREAIIIAHTASEQGGYCLTCLVSDLTILGALLAVATAALTMPII